MDVSLDKTGGQDHLSTADLAETGDESDMEPVDANEEGGVLQFYGTEPAGTGPDTGHHGPTASKSAKKWAQKVLSSAVKADSPAPVKVKQPDALQEDRPGMDVERDQDLGGLANKKASKIVVHRASHVPEAMAPYWFGAAQNLANKGQLVDSKGHVRYAAINEGYKTLLNHLTRAASVVK